MDLACYERFTENKAIVDPTLLRKGVFDNLLEDEESSVVTCCVIQKEISFDMRKIVIVWMKEVTEEQKCQLEVFLLAVNYMNRFLDICQIRRNQLQLLGTACMLIASKLRESTPLTAKLLIFYTDNSITLFQLLQFEQLILSKLKWDIAVVTPLDFLPRIVLKISKEPVGCSSSEIDGRAKALISYCACEHVFWRLPPSLIAASCIAAALHTDVRQMKYNRNAKLNNVLRKICAMTHIEMESLQMHVQYVYDMIAGAGQSTADGRTEQPDGYGADSRKDGEFTTPPLDDTKSLLEIATATTPTDVHDIDF